MNYRKAEEKSLRRQNELCADAFHVQEQLLKDLLRHNSQTEYGRRFHFSELRTVEDYQRSVPITEYSDYDDLIERQIKGEEKLLTTDPVVFYCISSGSVSQPKYIPATERDIDIQKTYLMDVVMGTIRKEMGDIPERELFGKIFQTGEFFKTFMPDGTMNGVRSGILHRWLELKGEIDDSWYTAPKEVLFPEKLEDMLYVKLRFALSCRDLTAIHGVFVHRLLRMFQYLERNWSVFLADVETGGVSECFQISEYWKGYLKEHLPPDPERAAELRAIAPNSDSLIRLIWKKIQYIRLVGGSIFESYMIELSRFTGDLPIHYFAYAASESCLGVACGMNTDDAYYVLIPEACFFEFIPTESGISRPLTFREVRQGERYELVITTLSGLYRYAVGDVVEVTGFFGEAPIIRICYRKNQIMDIADEKMNSRQLESAMRKFEVLTGCALEGYCLDAGLEGPTPFYLAYLEVNTGNLPGDAEKLLDECFMENCLGYKNAREMHEIGMVKTAVLKKGSFRAYEKFLMSKGYRMEQNKPLRILRKQEQKDFFKKEAVQ